MANGSLASDTSQLAGLSDEYSYSSFVYPLNLGVDGAGLDHYVIFYINQTTNTQYLAKFVNGKAPSAIPQAQQNAINDGKIGAGKSGAIQGGGAANIGPGIGNIGTPTTRVSTAIALYMPPDYMVKYAAKWGEQDMESASEAMNLLSNSNGKGVLDNFLALGLNLGASLINNGMDHANKETNMNLKGALSRQTRIAINPHAEVIFQGIGFRTFNFQFKFMPQSEAEADNVYNIIQAFKFYAAPEVILGAGSRFFIYPGEFDMQFIANGQENAALPKISTCALTNIDVTYSAAGQWAAFRAGNNHPDRAHPLFVHLSLSFTELEICTKQRVLQGM